MKFDFGGYATRYGIKCSDGRTIGRDAFKDCDGTKVPLVWQHLRDDPTNVVGNAILEHRDDGTYAYCNFNGTEKANIAKMLVEHGDITALSIYANHLTHQGSTVTHGMIREVSLVMAGANPSAFIDNIAISHSDGSVTELKDEAILYTAPDDGFEHSIKIEMENTTEDEDDAIDHSEKDQNEAKAKTVKEVFDSLTDDQKVLFYAMVGQALEQGAFDEDEAEQSDSDRDDLEHRAPGGLINPNNIRKVHSNPTLDKVRTTVGELNKIVGKMRFYAGYFTLSGAETGNGDVGFADEETGKRYKYGTREYNSFVASIKSDNKKVNGRNQVTHTDIEEGGNTMKKNVFEGQDTTVSLSHADRVALFQEVQKYANDHNVTLSKALTDFTDSFLEHGITDIESLFPDYKTLNNPPAWIGAPEAWVNTVWNGTSKTPFSRIKSAFADITKDEARARGYIKGKKKEEEQFSLLRRTTDPQTVYKLQKLDRDDIVDITDFDVVAWLKSEMRMKLQEELSRAILIGDGRSPSAEQKIQENHIRPILTDDVFYTLKYNVDLSGVVDTTDRANAIIDGAAYAMIDYKGSGGLTAFVSPQVLADLRVAKDKNGRRLYTSVSEIASALGVSNIVEVPLMKDLTRTTSTTIGDAESDKKMKIHAILVNLRDYNIGADRGGQTTMFDDFDIDYNKYTYLIETRCSGALIRPAAAIVLESEDVSG